MNAICYWYLVIRRYSIEAIVIVWFLLSVPHLKPAVNQVTAGWTRRAETIENQNRARHQRPSKQPCCLGKLYGRVKGPNGAERTVHATKTLKFQTIFENLSKMWFWQEPIFFTRALLRAQIGSSDNDLMILQDFLV